MAWKDALVEAGYARKGIKDGQLAAAKALFGYAVDNDLLPMNPALGIKLQAKRSAGSRMLPYSDDGVSRLLALADKETKPYRRWLPWLMALSGARVGEVAQLWGSRITEVDGVVVMKIAPAEDGGSLKNEGSERQVPIHPAILERGFLEFARIMGDGPLFYRGTRKERAKSTGRRHASKGVANHLAAWIRENGFSDKRKAPSHALRHWFKTACQRAGVLDSVADAIQGHIGSRGEADGYRHSSVQVMNHFVWFAAAKAMAWVVSSHLYTVPCLESLFVDLEVLDRAGRFSAEGRVSHWSSYFQTREPCPSLSGFPPSVTLPRNWHLLREENVG